jgi:hypothetical protein
MNNGMVEGLAAAFGERVWREAGEKPREQIERIYWIGMSRPPTAEERKLGESAIARLTEEWAHRMSGKTIGEAARKQALITYCHAIVNSAAFLYVD